MATQKLKALTQLPRVDLITGAANTRGGLLQPGLSVQKRKYDSIVQTTVEPGKQVYLLLHFMV